MATAAEIKFKDAIKSHENGAGLACWFYMDGQYRDLINIGYGFHFRAWADYEGLFRRYFLLPQFSWADGKNRTSVNMEDVHKDFCTVSRGKYTLQEAKRHTATRLSAGAIDLLFELEFYPGVEADVRRWYNNDSDIQSGSILPKWANPVYDALPEEAKFAMIDMMYNGGLNVLHQFKKLKLAIKKGDWAEAAAQCRFREISGQGGIKVRNDERAKYFEKLALAHPVMLHLVSSWVRRPEPPPPPHMIILMSSWTRQPVSKL